MFFEVGGRNKTARQLGTRENGFLAVDTDYTTETRKIPLWIFGLIGKP
jgi:hypothetical protein